MPANTENEVTFTLRVDPTLKDAFIAAARANDRSASLVIRDFMREYVRKNNEAVFRGPRKR